MLICHVGCRRVPSVGCPGANVCADATCHFARQTVLLLVRPATRAYTPSRSSTRLQHAVPSLLAWPHASVQCRTCTAGAKRERAIRQTRTYNRLQALLTPFVCLILSVCAFPQGSLDPVIEFLVPRIEGNWRELLDTGECGERTALDMRVHQTE